MADSNSILPVSNDTSVIEAVITTTNGVDFTVDNGIVASGVPKPAVICVFCGASPGTSPAHLAAARELANAMHTHGHHLVYGGGTSGLMGEVAKRLVFLSGPNAVHGIIPEALVKYERKPAEGDVTNITTTNVGQQHGEIGLFGLVTHVNDMHTRKQMMAQEVLSGGPGSGFIALTGGFGTIEEIMEIVTWNQLGIHGRGAILYNVEGFWDAVLQWINTAARTGFVKPENKKILVEAKTAEEAINALKEYKVSAARFNLDWSKS
ncbi:hypothetical protein BJ878DRAFT_430769 [Calycina marina]|uniref:Cytokinin riboside 5'-monophosphate phosphoribohydrolase n=1 Tax=Calycina marina TaxID=1763456 RepID=A0A9P7YUH1_9HELO|nr:hypothetical protein BJ878DRAFT_430769 [Calycina marina]